MSIMKGADIRYLNGQKFKITHEPMGDQFPFISNPRAKRWFVWQYYDVTMKFEYVGNFVTRGMADIWVRELSLQCQK